MAYPCGEILEFDQHDELGNVTAEFLDWHAGRITASRLNDAMAKLKKGGETAARHTLKWKIVAERLTKSMEQGHVTPAMKRGTDTEPQARTVYEIERGIMVRQVGMILHPSISMAAASPDGLIGDDGGIEIKCPESSTHLQYLELGALPEEYVNQVQFNMACSGRLWWDFMSFDPRLPKRYQTMIVRVQRDDAKIAEIESAVVALNGEVDAITASINGRCPAINKQKQDDPSDETFLTDADLELI